MPTSTPSSSSTATSLDRWSRRAFFALLAGWTITLIAIRTAHPGLELGDGLNDADVLHASNWFSAHGYRATAFLPVRETAFHPDYWPPTYNTFPPGVFYLHELQRLAGLSELRQFRVVSIALAAMAVYLWFAVVRRLTHSTPIAALAASLYMLSRPVLSYAPGFWEHVPMLSLFATLAAWLKHEAASTQRSRRLWLTLAALAMFLDSWLTLQHAVMLAFIITTRVLIRWWWNRANPATPTFFRTLATATFVCSMPAVVAVLRFGQQYLYAGSLKNTIDYFTDPLLFRVGDERFALSRLEVIAFWLQRLGFPKSIDGVATPPALVLYPMLSFLSLACFAGLIAILAWRWRVPEHKPFRQALLGAILLLAGAFTWPLVMKQHAYMHAFPVLMFLPGATLLLAGLCAWGLSCARAAPRVSAAVLAALAIVPLLGPLGDVQRSDTLNRVFEFDSKEHARLRRIADRYDLLAALPPKLAEDSVLRFAPRWPAFAYLLNRRFYQLARPMDLRAVPGEINVLDLNHPPAARAAAALALAMGTPDFVRAPGELAFVPAIAAPRDPFTQTRCLSAPVAPGASLVEVRLTRTIDGEAGIASVLIDGPLSPREAARTTLLVRAVAPDGSVEWTGSQTLGAVTTRSMGQSLGYRQRHAEAAVLAWAEIPPHAIRASARIEVVLITDKGVIPVVFDPADATVRTR